MSTSFSKEGFMISFRVRGLCVCVYPYACMCIFGCSIFSFTVTALVWINYLKKKSLFPGEDLQHIGNID